MTAPTSEAVALLDQHDQHSIPEPDMKFPSLWQYFADDKPARAWVTGTEDVYELIEDYGNAAGMLDAMTEGGELLAELTALRGFVVSSVGWASPVAPDGKPDGRPSRHPERKRVALSIAATRSGAASRVTFFAPSGEVENTMTEAEENPQGSLLDAIRACAVRVFGAVAW